MANAFQNDSGVVRPAVVSGNRDLLSLDVPAQWLVEGKIFEAGFGPEDVPNEENTQTGIALDDTKPSYALQAPAGAVPIVIPLVFKLMLSADGAPGQKLQVAFTKPAGLCATLLALSGGTALTSKHSLFRSNPKQNTQQATAIYGDSITATALVAADYISYLNSIIADAVLSTGLVALGEGPSNTHTLRFLEDGCPHAMTAGAAMLVYMTTQTTDAVIAAYMQWAEVEEDDLL